MGEVYRATQTSLGRQVAIKILSKAFASDPERLRRFEQEARAASALNHPNIISIYDVGSEDNTAYIAMEFVDGKTLRSLMETAPLGIKKSLQVAAQIADGLAKAHAAGIVHRDLKPENIMVTRDGFVKILDFGLAKLSPTLGDSQTMTIAVPATTPGVVMGTVGYMSPEQAQGISVDYRSDIFSLGSILYEMIAGKQAFKGPSSAQTLAAIIEDDPLALSEANPKTPTPLRWIIERCMAKDPDERYTSTRDLARDLQHMRDHLSDATSAMAVSAAPAIAAPSRSRWWKPALSGLAGLLLGAALTAWLWPRPTATSVTFHPLTFSGDDVQPSVSPDGRTVAFTSSRDGKVRIWLKQLGTGSETALSPGPLDVNPRFSPDGAWVLYTHNRAAYRIPAFGGEPRKLLDNVDDANWSPDGQKLVFVRKQTDGSRLTSNIGIASIGDGTSNIVLRVAARDLFSPAWAPDGSFIALGEQRAGTVGAPERATLLITPDGKTVHQLQCPVSGGALSPASWSADSRSVIYEVPESAAETGGLFQSPVGSPGQVFLQNVSTGKTRALFAVQSPISRIEIAGPGKLIFDSLIQRNNLKEMALDDKRDAGHWLTRGISIDRQPYYSPDGESVVFASSRSGDVDLWEVSTKTASLRKLNDNPAADWDPYVTPDNKYLLWSSNRTGNFEIWISERDGTSPRQVSHDGSDAENPAASPDGWVVYASSQTAHPGVWKVRMDGSQASLLVPGTVAWPDISPDGQYVLYHVPNGFASTIHVVRLSDGSPVEFTQSGRRARFSTDGRSIVYLDDDHNTLVRKPFPSREGTPGQVLLTFAPDQNPDTFAVSRDGKHLVVSFVQSTRSLVMAEGVAGIGPASRAK